MKKHFLFSVFAAVAICTGCTMASCSSDDKEESTILSNHELDGTYIEFFESESATNSKYDALWLSEAAKCVGNEKAAESVQMLKDCMAGNIHGAEAVKIYGEGINNEFPNGYQFDCHFSNGIKKMVINGSNIKGLDSNGKTVFSHNYKYIGTDETMGFVKYQTTDDNNDEFKYFFFMPDTPEKTYHTEFRYGSDPSALLEFYKGNYGYWMCAGVREGYGTECENAIKLFVSENLGGEE